MEVIYHTEKIEGVTGTGTTSRCWPANVRELRNVIERAASVAQRKALECNLALMIAAPVATPQPFAPRDNGRSEFLT